MSKTKSNTKQQEEPTSQDYLNGVHKDEKGSAWTKEQGRRYVDTLKLLKMHDKLQINGKKAVVNNLEQAVKEMAKLDTDFDKYMNHPWDAWKRRKYSCLYERTSRFHHEFLIKKPAKKVNRLHIFS